MPHHPALGTGWPGPIPACLNNSLSENPVEALPSVESFLIFSLDPIFGKENKSRMQAAFVGWNAFSVYF